MVQLLVLFNIVQVLKIKKKIRVVMPVDMIVLSQFCYDRWKYTSNVLAMRNFLQTEDWVCLPAGWWTFWLRYFIWQRWFLFMLLKYFYSNRGLHTPYCHITISVREGSESLKMKIISFLTKKNPFKNELQFVMDLLTQAHTELSRRGTLNN